MKQMKMRVLVLACAACLLLAVSASATVWDVADAFSTTANPNNEWRYWSWFSGTMTANGVYQSDTNIAGWWKDANSAAPYVLQTQTGAEYVAAGAHYLPDEVTMKSAGADWAVITWTAPATGNYLFAFEYTGRQEGGATTVQAYTPVLPETGWGGAWATTVEYGQTAALISGTYQYLPFVAGQAFDLYIQGDAVGLKGYFESEVVPEPSALVALFTGIVGVGSLAIRRKRS